MAPLQSNLTVTLDANISGSTTKIINDLISLASVNFNLETQDVLQVPNGANNQVVSLGGLTTATTVLMISDQPLTVKLNGEATGHVCQYMLLTSAAITAITLSNASGVAATPRIYMLG